MNTIGVATVLFGTFMICAACRIPSSCAELLLEGNTKSGVYTIAPRPWYKPIPFQVFCDMDTDGGGWTVFQRREDYEPRENFYRTWKNYKKGFGNLEKEFWLGNEHIFVLTNQDHVTLRIDLEDFDLNKRYAEYSQFQITNEKDYYRLTIAGYDGDAIDSLIPWHDNTTFKTYDGVVPGCAQSFKGGWWYKSCHASNLNGLYLKGKHESYADGVEWSQWLGMHYSLKKTEMKPKIAIL
uniref:Fibrinogen C-terminal domain-containing protein n=1 Tax=Strigamia maritima TaxID=126957 RepID=T1JG81_STRMM